MEVIRTIHPVGQGGFYTETHKTDSREYTVVYDCGGSSKKSIEEYLKRFLHKDSSRKKKQIDAVFVSHLHADHINGLEYLLENADVKLLILPQLTEEMVLEAFVFNNCYSVAGGSASNKFILDLGRIEENGYYKETRVVQVSPAIPEDSIDLETEEGGKNFADPYHVDRVIKSGTRCHFNSSWMFIPYNPPVQGNRNDFAAALETRLGVKDISFRMLPDIIKGKTDLCKRTYEDCFGKNHNSYSMTLFSGTITPERFDVSFSRCCFPFDCKICRYFSRYFLPNCLYTGDFEPHLFVDGLIEFYKPLWKSIHSIQVPHHGSRNNYDDKLYMDARLCFVSVGEKNRHRHPNLDTLVDIYSQGCFPIVVTDNPVTEKTFCFKS